MRFISNKRERIDKVVSETFGYSRAQVQKWIKDGLVLLNRKKVSKGTVVKSGDEIELSIPKKDIEKRGITPTQMPIEVIYEDKDIIAVNKPVGVVTHPACGHHDDTLLNGMVWYFREKGENVEPLLIHRLDEATSGIVLFAKNPQTLFKLSKQFSERKVDKRYIALVHGAFKIPSFSKTAIEKLHLLLEDCKFGCFLKRGASDRRKVVVASEGRWAVSEFFPKITTKKFSFLEVRPYTGRTHQIRVQLKFLGHSVAGDSVYSSKTELEEWYDFCRNCGIKPRMMLHAYSLKIGMESGEKILNTKIPKEFEIALKNIKNGVC